MTRRRRDRRRRRVPRGRDSPLGYWLPPHGRRPAKGRPVTVRRILLPFTGQAISRRAFEAAVRLAKAEDATIMPAFLARVPRNLPLDSPLPAQCADGDATARGDRAERAAARESPLIRGSRGAAPTATRCAGCSRRSSSTGSSCPPPTAPGSGSAATTSSGCSQRVPAEIMILRPAPDDTRRISANGLTRALLSAPRPQKSLPSRSDPRLQRPRQPPPPSATYGQAGANADPLKHKLSSVPHAPEPQSPSGSSSITPRSASSPGEVAET